MMALLEVEQFRQKLASLDNRGTSAKLINAVSGIAAKFRRYMLVRTLLSILTGLAIWAFALLAGLEPAIAWGLLAFALNYIPFIGSFVATLLPALFAIAQLETWQAVILVFIGLAAIRSSSATISSRSPRGPRSPSRPWSWCLPCSSGACYGAFRER